jgi:signal transduction histidine kinase
MPTFNNAQLAAFLNVLHEPAQLYDVRGNLIAENEAARGVLWPDEAGNTKDVIHNIDLGEGWFLRRMSMAGHSHAPARLSGQVGTRPNIQRLMSGITHELRNPLAAILTATSLLQDDPALNEETTLLLGVVRNEARRMNQILTEFSLYIKPPPPQPQAFDFAHMVRETLNELHANGTLAEMIEIKNHLPETLMVFADPHQMQQILSRLLQNAACALKGQSCGAITLFSYHQDDTERTVICIEDNGPGFSEEELHHAFTPFYSTKAQAVGLGLSIAQVAVQGANGAIWLENPVTPANATEPTTKEASSGARVCFALPDSPRKTE